MRKTLVTLAVVAVAFTASCSATEDPREKTADPTPVAASVSATPTSTAYPEPGGKFRAALEDAEIEPVDSWIIERRMARINCMTAQQATALTFADLVDSQVRRGYAPADAEYVVAASFNTECLGSWPDHIRDTAPAWVDQADA